MHLILRGNFPTTPSVILGNAVHGINTATIILTIQVKFTRKLQGALKAILLLEICQQEAGAMTFYPIFFLELNPQNIDCSRILVGTNG